MLGHETLRCVGGKWHNIMKSVAPSAKEIGTCCQERDGKPDPLPSDTTYTRRRVVLVDRNSRYEETCLVDVKLSDADARAQLWKALVYTPRCPDHVATRTLNVGLNSSLLESLAYAPRNEVLDVKFKDGATYRYFGVPVGVVLELTWADSKGAAYTSMIRNRYPCIQM